MASSKKNILFFQNSILPADGGVPRISDVVAKELTNRGYDCFFVYYDKDNDEYSQNVKLKVSFKDSYKNFRTIIFDFIRQNRIHIFVCQNTYQSSFIRLFKELRILYPSLPFISFLHASPDYWRTYRLKNDYSRHKYIQNNFKNFLKKVAYPFYNPYIKSTSQLYRLSDKFVLYSDSYKALFSEIYSINDSVESKVTILPNPLSFDSSLPFSKLDDKERIVLIISRLNEHQKKVSLALRIWHQLQNEHKLENWKLYIVGSGPDEEYYKKYVSDTKLQFVTFFGQKRDVQEFYSKSSIFMMTSIWEGFPMSLLEAQQNGVVPIAFDNFSAIYDIINDGENGHIIKNNDLCDYKMKLINLMESHELRKEMASKAIENSQRFQISEVVDKWEQLFKGCKNEN